jgi:hypothetical protein
MTSRVLIETRTALLAGGWRAEIKDGDGRLTNAHRGDIVVTGEFGPLKAEGTGAAVTEWGRPGRFHKVEELHENGRPVSPYLVLHSNPNFGRPMKPPAQRIVPGANL